MEKRSRLLQINRLIRLEEQEIERLDQQILELSELRKEKVNIIKVFQQEFDVIEKETKRNEKILSDFQLISSKVQDLLRQQQSILRELKSEPKGMFIRDITDTQPTSQGREKRDIGIVVEFQSEKRRAINYNDDDFPKRVMFSEHDDKSLRSRDLESVKTASDDEGESEEHQIALLNFNQLMDGSTASFTISDFETQKELLHIYKKSHWEKAIGTNRENFWSPEEILSEINKARDGKWKGTIDTHKGKRSAKCFFCKGFMRAGEPRFMFQTCGAHRYHPICGFFATLVPKDLSRKFLCMGKFSSSKCNSVID